MMSAEGLDDSHSIASERLLACADRAAYFRHITIGKDSGKFTGACTETSGQKAMQVPPRRPGLLKGGSPPVSGGVRKRPILPAPSPRADVDALEGMLCLAAATQQANTVRPVALKGAYEPMRQESVSSDNDYSEEQFNAAQRQERFSRGGHPESEEDKKEKRRLANREAARRMRRRRATHMQAVEEEVERLSNENSLLLHRMSQLVASHQQVDSENQQLRHELQCLRQSVGACLQVGQMDLANASLAAAAAGGALSPSVLAAQGKLALVPPEMPASGPSMAQRRLMIEQLHRAGGPTASGGQSTEEMTATEEERLKHTAAAPAPATAAHSFGSSGEAGPSTGGGSAGNGGPCRTVRKRGSWRPLSPA